MKKFLAYICLIIFSFQILPVKAIGEILFKGQITEEEVHGSSDNHDDGSFAKLKKEGDPFDHDTYHYVQDQFRQSHLSHELNTALHISENIPPHFIPDILTPPPNFIG